MQETAASDTDSLELIHVSEHGFNALYRGCKNGRFFVYKALKEQLAAVLTELQRINSGSGVSDDLLDTIRMIARIMDGMKEDAYGG